MKRLYASALLFSLAAHTWAADCIRVDDQEFDLASNEIGSAVVHWRAALKNQCRTTLDADLVIELLDGQSEPVYELLDKTTLGIQEQVEMSKEVYVPSRIVDEVEGFSIRVEERERQSLPAQ